MNGPPLLTAAGLLVDDEGKVLFGLRAAWKAAWPDYWDAIGGRVEAGETVDQALTRELREEIGVTATRFTLLAVVEGDKPDVYGEMLCHIFAVSAWMGVVRNACDEHAELRWFCPEELAQLPNVAGRGYPDLARRAIAFARS